MKKLKWISLFVGLIGVITTGCSGDEDAPDNPVNGGEQVYATEYYCNDCSKPNDPRHPDAWPPGYIGCYEFFWCIEKYLDGEPLYHDNTHPCRLYVPGTGGKLTYKLLRNRSWYFDVLANIYPLNEGSDADKGEGAVYCADDNSDSVTFDLAPNTTDLVICQKYRIEYYNVCGRCHKRFDRTEDFDLYIFPQDSMLDRMLVGDEAYRNPDLSERGKEVMAMYDHMRDLVEKSGLDW